MKHVLVSYKVYMGDKVKINVCKIIKIVYNVPFSTMKCCRLRELYIY